MLFEKFNYNEYFDKVKDKTKINKKLYLLYKDIYNKELKKVSKPEYLIMYADDFIVSKYLTFDQLKKYLYKEALISREKLKEIFSTQTFTKEEIDELTEILIKNPTKLEIKKIVAIETINFSEENLNKLKDYFDISELLQVHKNINGLIKTKLESEVYFDVFFSYLIHNKQYFTLEKVKKIFREPDVIITKQLDGSNKLNPLINKDKNLYISFHKWLCKIPIDVELKEKYPYVITNEILKSNEILTEELFKKYLTDFYNVSLNPKIEFSQTFLKKIVQKNIENINIDDVFTHLIKEKDVKEMFFTYIESYIKEKKIINIKYDENGEKEIQNLNIFRKKVFKSMGENSPQSMVCYLDIISNYESKYKVKLNFSFNEIVYLFNEKTGREHYDMLEKYITKEYQNDNPDLIPNSIFNKEMYVVENRNNFRYLLKYANIPEDFLIKHLEYFTNYYRNYKIYDDYTFLICNQKIPKVQKDFKIEEYFEKFNASSLISYLSVVESKEKRDMVIELIKNKHKELEKESYFHNNLFKNPKYILSLNSTEQKELYNKVKFENFNDNTFSLFACLQIIKEETRQEIELKNSKNHYGMSF